MASSKRFAETSTEQIPKKAKLEMFDQDISVAHLPDLVREKILKYTVSFFYPSVLIFSTPVVDLRLLFLHQQIEEKIKARKRLGWQKIDELIEWLNPDTQVGGKRDSLARYDQIRTGYLMMDVELVGAINIWSD